MPIKFLCPNGHQLTAPENLAGKHGKCPKCNTPFVVPVPDDEEEPDQETEVSGEEESADAEEVNESAAEQEKRAGASGPKIGQGSGKGSASDSGVFVFLCPNGHRLNGPPTLKGKPGQCPHCGAKFRIPSDDDLETPEEEAPEPELVAPTSSSDQQFVFPGFEQAQDPGEEIYEAVEVEDDVDPPPEDVNALGYIVGRLWDRKGEDSELEIFMNEGEIVAPEFYAEILSGREYGVFGSKEGDGTYSVTVIPWSSVRKVGLRKLPELSQRVFR